MPDPGGSQPGRDSLLFALMSVIVLCHEQPSEEIPPKSCPARRHQFIWEGKMAAKMLHTHTTEKSTRKRHVWVSKVIREFSKNLQFLGDRRTPWLWPTEASAKIETKRHVAEELKGATT